MCYNLCVVIPIPATGRGCWHERIGVFSSRCRGRRNYARNLQIAGQR